MTETAGTSAAVSVRADVAQLLLGPVSREVLMHAQGPSRSSGEPDRDARSRPSLLQHAQDCHPGHCPACEAVEGLIGRVERKRRDLRTDGERDSEA